ncbi:MAG: transglutaminase-like domain-containing protein [Candidatus Doudnabacteria bacterium]
MILISMIIASSNVAYAETVLTAGTISSGVDITITMRINVNNLDVNDAINPQFTYNAPIPTSSSVSGYSESVSNVNIVANPAPNSVADKTDQFGNPYRQFTWNVFQANGSSYAITVTTTFHADITGDANAVNYNDPIGYGGMAQYTSPTTMIQSTDSSIVAKKDQLLIGATSEADAVDRIMNFVKANLPTQVESPAQKDAVWSLNNHQGSCENRANLAIALMRSAGIPCRYVTGYLYGDQFPMSYSVTGGQATAQISWGYGPHSWVEVYYPVENVWVAYDPLREKGFVDSRHVKMFTSIDGDSKISTTHGDSGLFHVINVNQGISVSMTSGISSANLHDNNQLHQVGSTQPDPQGDLVMARILQSIATATPTATPTPTPTVSPTVTVTATPSPTANASVTPSPTVPANSTISPTPIVNSSTVTPTAVPTEVVPGDSGVSYKISGIVVSAVTQKPVENALVKCGDKAIRTGDNGIFAFFEPNCTVMLDISAEGYRPDNCTVIVSGQDQSVRVELNALPTASPTSTGAGLPIPGPTILITIAIFTGSAALLWRARDR